MALRSGLRVLCSPAGTPAAAAAAAAATTSCSSILQHCQLFSSSTSSSNANNTGNRGSTAGELGDKAAQNMSGSGEAAAGKTRGVEGRVADAGFVPRESNAVPDPDAAGQAGGVGADAVGDMADMVGAMFSGDQKRVGHDVADMTRQREGVDRHAKTPHSTAAEWPKGIFREAADTADGAQKTSTGEVVDRFDGTIPGSSPPSSPPEIDQNPPESVTAGPTSGYTARGGDNRPV